MNPIAIITGALIGLGIVVTFAIGAIFGRADSRAWEEIEAVSKTFGTLREENLHWKEQLEQCQKGTK